jgi:pimeloyl-ACP methyl ester carboxylesterase
MSSPHPTADDLRLALARYDAEARPGAFHTGRYRLRYSTWGDAAGRPLVFVHGLADVPRSFAMLMRPLVEAGFRCIGYDLADSRSDGANLGMYRHPHYADDLVALLDHLGVAQADVLGSSFGSTITLRALAAYPARFRRGILQGGFARRPLLRIERGLARLGRYWPGRMSDLIIRERAMLRLEGKPFAGCAPEVLRFLLHNSGQSSIRAVARRALLLDRLDLRPLLPTIAHPVLMIGGDRDTIVPRRWEAEVEAGLKNVRRVELSPCGHYPQYTLPRLMAEAVREFLA